MSTAHTPGLSRRKLIAAAATGLASFRAPSLAHVRAARRAAAVQEREQWKNWSGLVQWSPELVARPEDESDVIDVVREAAAAGRQVRAAGTGHSFTPLCATDGVTMMLSRMSGVVGTDREHGRATVRGGSKLYQLHEPLRQAGLAMTNLPDIDRQALAGAIATATHGTGRALGSLSTQITGARIVTGSGEVIECSRQRRPEVLKAAQVSLGCLGIFTELTLELVPAFRLHEKTAIAPFEQCIGELEQQTRSNRHFEFFWVANRDACLVKSLNVTDEREDYERYDDETRLTGERVGPSGDVFPSLRNTRFNEIEYSVPEERGPDCFRELRELMTGKHKAITWPLEYRTVAADDAYLSPMYERPTVTLSLHQAARLEHRHFFADAEAVFRNHQGRPHWGKIHSLDAKQLRELYPEWEAFAKVRAELDPKGVFLNDHLREVLSS